MNFANSLLVVLLLSSMAAAQWSAIACASHSINVSIGPQNVTLSPAGSQQFAAAVYGTTNKAVSWSLVSGTGSIDASGKFTAPSGTCAGENDLIVATSAADPSKSASILITILPLNTHRVILTWTEIDVGDLFNVYRSQTSGGPYTRLQSSIIDLTVTDSTVFSGQTYYYVITALANAQESAFSPEVQAIVPCP